MADQSSQSILDQIRKWWEYDLTMTQQKSVKFFAFIVVLLIVLAFFWPTVIFIIVCSLVGVALFITLIWSILAFIEDL